MTDKEQTDAFADELDKLVDRFRQEFDLTYAQAVGVLHMKAHLLCEDASERGDEV
jgi:hypothetical protein